MDKNTFLAVVLSGAIMIIWYTLFPPPEPPPREYADSSEHEELANIQDRAQPKDFEEQGSTLSTSSNLASIAEIDSSLPSKEVILENEGPIAGFQFQITGLEVTGVSGGSAEDSNFSISTSNNGIIVGFSFSWDVIPAGNNTLTYIHYESITNQITELNDIILSNPNAETISDANCSSFIDHGEPDCAGSWEFTSSLDECGICNGPGAIYECGCSDIPPNECDCEGSILDECGICDGDNASCYFTLYIGDFDLDNQTIDIMITNPEDIAGFQFNLTGLSLDDAYGGLAEEVNFSVSTGGNGNVLGFSFSGDIIPAQDQETLLTTISFSNVIGNTYRVYPEENTDLQALPFGRMRLNS